MKEKIGTTKASTKRTDCRNIFILFVKKKSRIESEF
jgi:hypothetical protein